MIDKFGGAIIKYPYSAGGKGSRVILDTWQIKEVYDALITDYSKDYRRICGTDKKWPLLIESRMSGVEISFTVLVDKNGRFQILPTAMDYPERFAGPASKDNPITGGMGSISPHPMNSQELIEMAGDQIIKPFVDLLSALKAREKDTLRPCVLYPGCIVTFDSRMRPKRIRMCEMNIRPGEPEFQPVTRRLRNLGQLIKAMFDGNLHEIRPEVREDQISVSLPLVTGPGGPDGQKGYPGSCTKNESLQIDLVYCKKKNIQLIPSGMSYDEKENVFKSDGTRIVYLNVNGSIKEGEKAANVAERLQEKLLIAFDSGKIKVVPRENPNGNRLDLRRDVGGHYLIAEKTFLPKDACGDIVAKLKSAVGKDVIILTDDGSETKGVLTEFDETCHEAEINKNSRIGTQAIKSIVLS
jgi:phosphoribosylamine--glycine ligase